MYCLIIGWSLSAVKQALSHLRWQRDRLDHLHASATSLHGSDTLTPHQKIMSMIVDLVGLVFSQQGGKGKLDDSEDSRDTPSTDLMNRVVLIRQLMGQRRRAMVSYKYSIIQTLISRAKKKINTEWDVNSMCACAAAVPPLFTVFMLTTASSAMIVFM